MKHGEADYEFVYQLFQLLKRRYVSAIWALAVARCLFAGACFGILWFTGALRHSTAVWIAGVILYLVVSAAFSEAFAAVRAAHNVKSKPPELPSLPE